MTIAEKLKRAFLNRPCCRVEVDGVEYFLFGGGWLRADRMGLMVIRSASPLWVVSEMEMDVMLMGEV